MLTTYYLEGIGYEYEYFCYTGEDCLDDFVEKMDKNLTNFGIFLRKHMLALTNDEKIKHSAATICYLPAEKVNQDKNHRKVKDHCYYTGKYRGPAHLICNLDMIIT